MGRDGPEDIVDDELRNPEQRWRQQRRDDSGYQPQNNRRAPGLPYKTQHRRYVAQGREPVAPTAPKVGPIVHSLNLAGRGGVSPRHWKRPPRHPVERRTPESGRSVQGKRSQLPKRHLDEENALTVGLQGVCGLTSTSPSEVLLLLKTCSLHAPLGLRTFHKRLPHEPRSQILRHQQNDPRVDADYV